MELQTAAKKTFSQCDGAISSCPGSQPKATCPEYHFSHVCQLKGGNEVKPENVHRSPGICLTTEEDSGKLQLGDSLMKAVRPIVA